MNRSRLPCVVLLIAMIAACGHVDRSPRPEGDWVMIADGNTPHGRFEVHTSAATTDDSVCVNLGLTPPPDLGPRPDNSETHLGREYGCVSIPTRDRAAEFSEVVLDSDYNVVLALMLEDSSGHLTSESDVDIPNGSSGDASGQFEVYIAFPAREDAPTELVVVAEDGGWICPLPDAEEFDPDCRAR